MVGETNEITFTNLSVSDGGIYRCNVGNEATSKFVNKRLAVNCKSFGYHQKQPPEMFCKKRCSWKFRKIHRKTHLPESLFNEVAGSRPATLLTMRLWHGCFPVNFVKFLRTSFLQNTSGGCLQCKPLLSAGGTRAEPPTNFSKRGGFTGSQFLEGVDFFQVGVTVFA